MRPAERSGIVTVGVGYARFLPEIIWGGSPSRGPPLFLMTALRRDLLRERPRRRPPGSGEAAAVSAETTRRYEELAGPSDQQAQTTGKAAASTRIIPWPPQ